LRCSELNTCVLSNDLRNARGDQQQRLAIVSIPHERDGFPLKSAHLPIGQDRFQPISNLNPGAVVVNGIQNQYSAVGGLAPHAPLMEEIDRVTLDIGAIERPDGHHRDLSMCLPVNLPADLVHLRDRVLVQNVGKVVDVVGGFELGDRFGLRRQNQQQSTSNA